MRPPKRPLRKPKPSSQRRPAKRAPVKRESDSAESDGSSAGGERLQKFLAQAGIASRRACEEMIREGRVEIDRQVVTELGTRVDPLQQEVRVDGEVLSRPRLAYFAINKPTGIVCTASDPDGRPRILDLLPDNAPRVICVGRLDMASEGLILATNDGELANGLTHPKHGVEKIYQVQVAGHVEPSVIAQLHRGIHLAEGFAHVKHVRIKSARKNSTILEMVLDEGRNREVRRLLAKVGHKVQQLKRIAVGPVRLGELPTGAVRLLSKQEVSALHMAVTRGLEAKSTRDKARKPRKSPQKQVKRGGVSKEQQDARTVIGG